MAEHNKADMQKLRSETLLATVSALGDNPRWNKPVEIAKEILRERGVDFGHVVKN